MGNGASCGVSVGTALMAELRVYVLRLQNRVWEKSKDFRDANPDYEPGKPVVYVGSTGKSIDERIADHLAGGMTSNRFVKRYFKRKMTTEYADLPVCSDRQTVEVLEAATAKELRARRWGVWVGVPSTAGIGQTRRTRK